MASDASVRKTGLLPITNFATVSLRQLLSGVWMAVG